ncbi:MAG TPA: DUF1049 domain-containing protein [Erysipelothrix sp.]|nr:DUF1049 domain-containing protein [Erysipelothrix sp.]
MSEVKLSRREYKAYKPKRGPNWKIIVGAILLVLLGVFAFINRTVVKVNFLFTTIDLPLILVILASFVVGALVSLLIYTFRKPN